MPATHPAPTGMDAIRPLFQPLAHAHNEMATVAYLNRDHRLLGMRHVTGGRDWLALSVRTVAADVLAYDASAVMLAHNHPSGDPAPSQADFAYTRRLCRALDALGVSLLDHVVLAVGGNTSLRAMGYL
jgi:DNA repair protein RadC